MRNRLVLRLRHTTAATAISIAVAAVAPFATTPAAPARPAASLSSATTTTTTRPTDAVSAFSREIRFFEQRIKRDPDDMIALNRVSGEYLGRFRETGDDRDLERALTAAEQSLKVVPAELNRGGLTARAYAGFSLHRFTAARDDVRRLIDLEGDKRYLLELLADASLELGDYAEASDVYAKLDSQFQAEDAEPTLEARLARLAMIRGDRDTAARRYDNAVSLAQATASTPPVILSWVLVQAGQFDFMAGRWEQAEKRYRAALDAKPDDWPALDHLAELRAAQKRYDEAVSAYVQLVERVPRPELFQALGDVYREMGKQDEARTWHARAIASFRQAADRGSAHYFHHLAGFYCDVEPNPAEALRWAREDMKVRHSVYAQDALAWARYAAGDYPAAAEAMDKVLALGTADAHLLYHGSLIYTRAGDPVKGQACLRKAAEINPHFMAFHVHR